MFGRHPVTSAWTFEVAADQATTWAVFSDTDRFNAAAGLDFTFEEAVDPDTGRPTPRGGMRRMGLRITWDELPWRFEAPRWFRIERRFHGGPAAKVEVELSLTAKDPGCTEVSYKVHVTPRNAALRPVLMAEARTQTQPQLSRALEAAGRMAEAEQAGGSSVTLPAPDYDAAPPPLDDAAKATLHRALKAVSSDRVAELIDAIVVAAPLRRQDRIHPTAIARAMKLPEAEVVRGFLEAAAAGGLALRWELLCPRCRAPKATLETLGTTPREVHCRSCNVRYDGSFPDSVVVSFRPAPAVRRFEVPVECMLSPQRTPHVLLQDQLGPRDLDDWELELPRGVYRLELGSPGDGGGAEVVLLEVIDDALTDVATISVGPDGPLPRRLQVRTGPVRLVVRSRLREALGLVLRRRVRSRPRLSLAALLGIPGVLPLLPEGALADGLVARVTPGVALAVDEVLGRSDKLEPIAGWLQEQHPDSLCLADGRLLAAWTDPSRAVAAIRALAGDLRVAASVDLGDLVFLEGNGQRWPCGAAVDRASETCRSLGAGRVGLSGEMARTATASGWLDASAELVADGTDGVVLLRGAQGRDRYVAWLAEHLPQGSPQRLGERYQLVEEVDSGGQGWVYLARDDERGRAEQPPSGREDLVAKVMHPEVLANPRLVQFFVDEARIAASLDHPGIPKVHDVGVAPGEQPWMVMDRVFGGTLRQWVQERGPLGVDDAVAVGLGVLDALGAVHAAGLVHRDVKPENIMVDEEGRVFLLDLGIARLAHDDNDPTADGHVLGTPTWLAPEQLRAPALVGPRTDLYSLGLVLSYALLGVEPFSGSDPVQVALARLRRDPPDLVRARPELPDALVNVVYRAHERDPERRFSSAAEMSELLRSVR